MDKFIESLDVPIRRDPAHEAGWDFERYSTQVEEALEYHCATATVSRYLKHQISQIIHQGYLAFGDTLFAAPVRSIYEAMENVTNGARGRGLLKNISRSVGFEIHHIHFSQSSCIIENEVNHAKKTKLFDQPLTQKVVYENLISSLDKGHKTGEWLVYSKMNGRIKFWCIWLHKAGDDELSKVINEQCAYQTL